MFWRIAQFLFLLSCVTFPRDGAAAPQAPEKESERRFTVDAIAARSSYAVHVWAKEAQGYVEVRAASGAAAQTLNCPLLRDNLNPSDSELEAVRARFVDQFAVLDLNMDGYPDLMGPREFGAKWARYCVWLFDPLTRRFVNGSLAKQMEELYNLSVDPDLHQVVSSSIGPDEPR